MVEAGFKRLGKRCLVVAGVGDGRGVVMRLLCLSGEDLMRSRKLGGKRSSWGWGSRGRGRIPVISWRRGTDGIAWDIMQT